MLAGTLAFTAIARSSLELHEVFKCRHDWCTSAPAVIDELLTEFECVTIPVEVVHLSASRNVDDDSPH